MAEDNKVLENDDSTVLNENSTQNEEEQIDINLQDSEKLEINSELQKDVEEFVKKNKKSSLKKVLFSLIAFLLLLIIIAIALFFLGFFTPEEEKKEEVKPIELKQEITKEEVYKFDIKDINSKKLNEQLASLTNKNLNQEKDEELEKAQNEKKLLEEQKRKDEELLKQQEDILQKEKIALEETKVQLEKEKAQLEALKQEALAVKQELLSEQNNETVEKIESATNTNQSNNDIFLKFINVAKIKGVLYKKYLDKIVAIDPNVKLCRDDKNRIEIYYGPFKDEVLRKELLDKLIKNNFNQSYALEFTKEEFDSRCNY